jgi:hypothetical protein
MSDPVTSGRDALNHWVGGYPWYDSKADAVQRVKVPKPWNWPGGHGGDWAFSLGSLLQALAWLAVALLLAALVYFVVRAIMLRERRKSGGEEVEPAGRADRVEALPLPVDARHLDLLAEAERCRQQGEYGRAIVFLFSHQLLQLDKHGRIHLARGKTNRQYLREIRPWPALGGMVEQTTLMFEDVFFGHHKLEAPAFEACWSRLEEFDKLLGNA